MDKVKYTVESGEERWNYDSNIPTHEVVNYWVMLGKQKVKTFSFRIDADKYAERMNKQL